MSTDEIKAGENEFEDADPIDYEGLLDQPDGPLFFSLTVKPEGEVALSQPKIPGFILHITNACFGVNVQKGTRTVVLCKPNEDEAIPICVLTQQHQNHSLDLLFNEGSSFALKGNKVSAVTLTGYCQPNVIPEMDAAMEDGLNEQEIAELYRARREAGLADSDEAPELLNAEENVINEINGNYDIDDEEVTKRAIEKPITEEPPTKKRKMNKPAKETVEVVDEETKESPSPKVKPEKEKKKKNKNKKKKKEKGLRVMKGGIRWRDMKDGTGAEATDGQTMFVYYVGQLDDKNVFDKAITGDGFSFVLGANEVIKGWDIGLKGMKVGAKRRLIIPPKMAYGKNGSPPKIPANATLTFTIELKSIA